MNWRNGTRGWNLPLDPACPEWVKELSTLWDDPMTAYSGVGDEIQDDLEKVHRNKCQRCRDFGVENIEMV
jgi:hypothetical protein